MTAKDRRLAIFIERLSNAPSAASAEEALRLVSTTLNDVENEFTNIIFDPARWLSDGRMSTAGR